MYAEVHRDAEGDRVYLLHLEMQKTKMRVLLDARRSNLHFRRVSQVCTAEDYSRIEIELPPGVDPGSDQDRELLARTDIYLGTWM